MHLTAEGVTTLLESREQLIQIGMVDRFPGGIRNQVALRYIGSLMKIVHQHVIPRLVFRGFRPGHLIVPLVSALEARIHVNDNTAVAELDMINQLPD